MRSRGKSAPPHTQVPQHAGAKRLGEPGLGLGAVPTYEILTFEVEDQTNSLLTEAAAFPGRADHTGSGVGVMMGFSRHGAQVRLRDRLAAVSAETSEWAARGKG